MKVTNKKKGNITYYKYRVNLPIKAVQEAKLLNKDIIARVENNKIILEEEFKRNVKSTLTDKEKILQKELVKLIEKRKKFL